MYMRTKRIIAKCEQHSGYGAGAGDTEYYEYECPCGKGTIIEEHDNIPGFREHSVYLHCTTCSKEYIIDTSAGTRNWKIVRKKVNRMKTQPYICRVHIENFRNFHSADFSLGEKQVLIGENAVGKSNLLYALQLILDPTLSEKDRMLEESDFWDGIENPMDNGHYILIEIYLANFEDNKNLLAQLADASVMVEGKETLKISYKFFKKDATKPDYSYIIYKGNDESRAFTYEDRKMLNIRVIKAIRDVEAEMKSSRTSPLTQIIKQKYSVSKSVLLEISKALDEKGADTLQIGQVNDLENRLQRLLNDMVSFSADEFSISLKTMNIDATKLLYALRPLINSRETGNTSLGINNILYVALILLLIEDDTIKTFLSGDLYRELIKQDHEHLLERSYEKSASSDDYALNLAALQDATLYDGLYAFFSDFVPTANGITILAVEEPESHLHPIYQRLLYRHILLHASGKISAGDIVLHSAQSAVNGRLDRHRQKRLVVLYLQMVHIEVHGFLDELIFALAVVGGVPLLDPSSGFRLHPECNALSGFFTHSIPPFCCKTSLKNPATRGFSGKLTPSELFLSLKDASFKRPKLPALRAEVAAAATPATPCLYPAFSFVLSNPSENGSHPVSTPWLGLGLSSSRKGAHKAFWRPCALDFLRSSATR